MPLIGFGTWQLAGAELERVLEKALELGYRLIDTAAYYNNEQSVGYAIARAHLPRDHVFVTTKIRGRDQGRGATRRALAESLERLNLDFVDLALIHWPLPMRDLYVETWEELIDLRSEGLARSIGVSNFNPWHIERLVAESGVCPSVNQVQCNPAVPNLAMRRHALGRSICIQAWEPLGTRSNVLAESAVRRVAAETGRTPAQVVLRWHIERRTAAIPRTSRPERAEENFDIWDWTLSDTHLAQLDELDRGGTDRADPDVVVVE